MKNFIQEPTQKDICSTCGTRYGTAKTEQDGCPICLDERQYVGDHGQVWTSYEEIAEDRSIRFTQLQPNLIELKMVPNFAIGQKAHLVLTESGNILWDCLPFLDAPTVAYIKSLGGLKAIAISHPHYYSLMVEWAEAFDCPVYLHEADQQWIQNPSEHINLWSGVEKELWAGIKIVNVGGHFDGSTILHLPHHGEKGTILTGDSIYVARDRKHVSFMYSYPNLIPLNKNAVQQINERVKNLTFETIHGAFEGQVIWENGKEAFNTSVLRYLAAIT